MFLKNLRILVAGILCIVSTAGLVAATQFTAFEATIAAFDAEVAAAVAADGAGRRRRRPTPS